MPQKSRFQKNLNSCARGPPQLLKKHSENRGANSADCKRGQWKGATSKSVKNRQKVSKIFSTLFDFLRAGQKTSKIVNQCQKYFRHFATFFARHQFSGPFWGPLTNENLSCGFPSIPGIAPGVAPRIVVFVLIKSWDVIPRMDFRIPRMEFRIPRAALEEDQKLALFKSPCGWGVNKNGVSNFLRSIGHFFLVRSNCWGLVPSENKCVCAPKPCIMRSFGLKMQHWKSKFLYRYRPEGIFRIFFRPASGPPPPVHMLLQRKKANSFVPAIFSPMAWPF